MQILRTVFPYKINVLQRTKESFGAQTQKGHHKGVSPLLELSDQICDIVQDLVSDYMHMACLGTMKRKMTIFDRGFQVVTVLHTNLTFILEQYFL